MTTQPFRRLLAKSTFTPDTPRHAETLAGHLENVTRVARGLAENWGERALESVGLKSERWMPHLLASLPRGAWLHDLGKANQHFQRMIRAPGADVVQAIRHEQVSVWLLLTQPDLESWLFNGCDEVARFAAVAATANHHVKFEGLADLRPRRSDELSVTVLTGHSDVRDACTRASRLLGLGPSPILQDTLIPLGQGRVSELRRWSKDAQDWWDDQDRETRVFVALLKALLIGADVAGSALARAGLRPDSWARWALARVCDAQDLTRVVLERLGGNSLRPFQEEMAAIETRVSFVRAGCGSGKTAGAYAWASRRAAGRKLFFCYPTTGTATEGFADYVSDVDGVEAALVHSRADADLEAILDDGADEHDGIASSDATAARWVAQRRRSLESWDAKVTVATVDAVVGLMQNARRGLFSSPAIVNGAFVFDEIHSYDDQLFGSLLAFLRTFRGAPILLMTASLQQHRLDELRALISETGETLGEIPGPAALEAIPRYLIGAVSPADARSAIDNALKEGRRVLWVTNTVERCREFGRAIQTATPVLPYHSRYRYEDRVKRHRGVMAAFRRGVKGPAVAVTTQVCEVSLDISADLLVTELAPTPALIQRMGRLNRWITEVQPASPKWALVVEPEHAAPYDEDELKLARTWLSRVSGGPVSQADLASQFLAVSLPSPGRQEVAASWLEGGPFAAQGSLREPGMTISVLRTEDRTAGMTGADVTRRTIPMLAGPVVREIGGWAREGLALVAPRGRVAYDPIWGAKWA